MTEAHRTARELAAKFGLHRSGHQWRGACWCCGYSNSFVLADGKHGPIGWCASCQNREAIAVALGRPQGAHTTVPQHNNAADVQARVERAERVWRGSMPLPDTPGAAYLFLRGIGHLVACADLRFHSACSHPSGTLERPVRQPALVAAVRDVTGKFVGVHRTYLRRDGSGKAEVEPAKASLGPISGAAVRLAPIEQVLELGKLVVAEGIESAASAALLLRLPAWAAMSAGNLAKHLELPEDASNVVIAADPDGAGRGAAYDAWLRWKAEGRHIQIAMPDREGCDFNDMLLAREPANG
jgi:hypothetical protein